MNEEIILPDEVVASKIYQIRGQKVMLDRDLAELYDVKATRLREQVKRNNDKFPEHFMFQLNELQVRMIKLFKSSITSNSLLKTKKHQ